MINKEQIEKLVREFITDGDLFIVDITVNTSSKIMVFLDSDNSVTIDDCKGISRHIEKNLDREIEDFELQVSSSGLGEALKLVRQYKNRIGKELNVVQKDGTKYHGTLKEADDDSFQIELRKKKKEKTSTLISFKYTDVKETKENIKI